MRIPEIMDPYQTLRKLQQLMHLQMHKTLLICRKSQKVRGHQDSRSKQSCTGAMIFPFVHKLQQLYLIKYEHDAHSSTILHIFRSGSSKPNGSELSGDPQYKCGPTATGEKDRGITVALQLHLIVQHHTRSLALMFRGLNLSYLTG